MANFFSDLLTARDAQGDITDPGSYAGYGIVSRAFISLTANPADDDVLMMLDIPSNGRPNSIYLYNTDLGTSSVADFGIYAGKKFTDSDVAQTVYLKDEVINVNAFYDASTDLNTSNQDTHIETRFQSSGSSSSLDRINDPMWLLADLDSDPRIDMRIGIALPTNWDTFVAGTIALICQYTGK